MGERTCEKREGEGENRYLEGRYEKTGAKREEERRRKRGQVRRERERTGVKWEGKGRRLGWQVEREKVWAKTDAKPA